MLEHRCSQFQTTCRNILVTFSKLIEFVQRESGHIVYVSTNPGYNNNAQLSVQKLYTQENTYSGTATSGPIDVQLATVRLVTRLFTSSSSSSSSSSTSSSLSHGYELCRRCSRENPTMHIFSIVDAANRVRWRAPRIGCQPLSSPPLLSNLVTLMPEIDDISPGQASRSPAALMTSS